MSLRKKNAYQYGRSNGFFRSHDISYSDPNKGEKQYWSYLQHIPHFPAQIVDMTTVLITGANKVSNSEVPILANTNQDVLAGPWSWLRTKYLSRPDTVVVAAVRNPAGEDFLTLPNLDKAKGSRLVLAKIESTSETDALKAVEDLKNQGVSHLDIVIANAGIFKSEAFLEVSKMESSDLIEHVDVNVNGPVRLFQATLPLLQASKQPKFAVISSRVGTIAGAEYIPWAVTSYGASKAALNFLLRRIHIENKDLIVIAFNPG